MAAILPAGSSSCAPIACSTGKAMRAAFVFFYSPSGVAAMQIAPGQRFRLGGLVETGSVVRGEGTTVRFAVTDQAKTLPVTYTGVLPDLFREGQGVWRGDAEAGGPMSQGKVN